MIFTKPPLVELIAELRWGAPAMVLPGSGVGGVVPSGPAPITLSSRVEELFMRFGAKVAADGYSRFERIVPSGFPLMPFQPVYRYRKTVPEEGTSLYQLGPGVFTANITPPYQSWEQFRPVVEVGVNKLLDTRDETDKTEPFGTALLRYIDAFGPDFTQGSASINFITEKLGFLVKLPDVIDGLSDKTASIRPALQFGVQLRDELFMKIAVGDGVADGLPAIILDTTVSTMMPVGCSLNEVMGAFDRAHSIIREAFIGMTQPIASLMQPTHGEKS